MIDKTSAEEPIPEDLKALHHEAKTSYYLQCYCGIDVFPLIERIGRVEKERNQLRVTQFVDGLTIVHEHNLLDKYTADNTALTQENDKLKLFADAACALLGTPEHKIATLHCIIEDNAALKAENSELKARLTMRTAQLDSTLETADREWNDDEDVYKERDRLKAQVERLQWKSITKRNLPKEGDELLHKSGEISFIGLTDTWKTYTSRRWHQEGYFSFRPINAYLAGGEEHHGQH